MPKQVHCIAEFLPIKGHEQELLHLLNELATETLANEKGCLKYCVTQQIPHRGATGKSKFTIVSIEEFKDWQAFDIHCNSSYVADFIQKYIEPKDTPVEDLYVRLFENSR